MNKEPLLLDFKNALLQFEKAMSDRHESDLEKAGCIQYFEFCFELAWKTTKTAAEEMGINDCQSPRAALKCAFSQGWIDDEALWLDMLACRNRMTHTYEANSALKVYNKLDAFVPAFKDLYAKLCGIK
jgi:nucleotidyltransferase substrate binding protein (TIGR01987 family)